MIDAYSDQLELLTCQRAAQTLAELAVWTAHDPEITDAARLEVVSAYVIATAYAYGGAEDDSVDFEHALYRGIVDAGGDEVQAANLAAKVTDPTVFRKIFSLLYFKKDRKGFGIRVVSPRKKWLDPKVFIESAAGLSNN